MSISPIDPSTSQVIALDALPGTIGITPPTDTDGAGTGAAASVSPFAQIMSQLQQLQQSSPAALKNVLGDIATQLQGAAQQNGSPGLSDLANRFQQASQTGDLSKLQPHHHGHGHHHGGAAAYQQTSDQSSLLAGTSPTTATDPRTQALDIIQSVLAADSGATAAA